MNENAHAIGLQIVMASTISLHITAASGSIPPREVMRSQAIYRMIQDMIIDTSPYHVSLRM
jgi:hypothetical protein